jgi:signal transduction histidine kinase
LLDNLVSNAIKFTDAGGEISVRLRRGDAGAVLEVSDTGVGIPAEDQPRVFERFYRTDVARAAAIQGSGLGLAIVKMIADAHGARIELESEDGMGSTFRVILGLNEAIGQA